MQMLLLSFGAWSGLYGAVSAPRPACFLPKTSPLCRFAPRGETPRRFSPHPFCGAGAKDKRLYRFLIRAACVRQPPQCCGDRRPRGLNARVHSVFCFSLRKKKTSLAPCALGGDRLATTVCGQTPLVVVTYRPAYLRPQNFHRRRATAGPAALVLLQAAGVCVSHFIFHLSSFIIVDRRAPPAD